MLGLEGGNMYSRFLRFLVVLAGSISLLSWGQRTGPQSIPQNGGTLPSNTQPQTKVPEGVLLVKGAWWSASDSVTLVPEGGSVTNNVFRNQYFGMTYALPPDWTQEYDGPPPSDSGLYVLAQVQPADTYKEPTRGTILITAQDMFFTPLPVTNALQLIDYRKDHLQADYKVEMPPAQTKIADRSFTFFAYWSPVAQLHWYVLATEIRCHAVEIVLTSRDTKLLESLLPDMNKMKLPADASPTAGMGGGAFPVCVKDYARDERVIAKVDPVFSEHRFNAVPVRIIIDKDGKVKHIHFLSAFPDQAKAITDALGQWKFKPYLQDGHPVEVETGIMFGSAPHRATSPTSGPATQ
jgi:Gram-negative bacterial TonB protein C-terminal